MDDFIGRRNLVAPDRFGELTRRSDWKGAIRTLGRFRATGATCTGSRLTLRSRRSAPWFVLHGMLRNHLSAAQHECNHCTAP